MTSISLTALTGVDKCHMACKFWSLSMEKKLGKKNSQLKPQADQNGGGILVKSQIIEGEVAGNAHVHFFLAAVTFLIRWLCSWALTWVYWGCRKQEDRTGVSNLYNWSTKFWLDQGCNQVKCVAFCGLGLYICALTILPWTVEPHDCLLLIL